MVAVQERAGGASAAIFEELRIHLHRTHPKARLRVVESGREPREQEQALAALEQAPPAVLVVAGSGLLQRTRGRPWPRTRALSVGVSEHGSLRGQGVVDGCPPEALVLLPRKMLPGARALGWIHDAREPVAGAFHAAMIAAAASGGFSIERVDARAPGALAAAARRLDALLLPSPLLDETLHRSALQVAQGAGRAIFSCDREGVAAGVTAGLVTDPQQVGETIGALVAEALDGKEGRVVRVEMGRIAVNLGGACAAGAKASAELLSHAEVFEKDTVCPEKVAPEPRRGGWWALALGSLVVAAGALRLRRKRRDEGVGAEVTGPSRG